MNCSVFQVNGRHRAVHAKIAHTVNHPKLKARVASVKGPPKTDSNVTGA